MIIVHLSRLRGDPYSEALQLARAFKCKRYGFRRVSQILETKSYGSTRTATWTRSQLYLPSPRAHSDMPHLFCTASRGCSRCGIGRHLVTKNLRYLRDSAEMPLLQLPACAGGGAPDKRIDRSTFGGAAGFRGLEERPPRRRRRRHSKINQN